MKLYRYRCDICGQYIDDYQHINKGGNASIQLIRTAVPKRVATFDICDPCYDFLEAYTNWDQETRKDIYNYVINKQVSTDIKLVNEEADRQEKLKIKPTK